MNEYYIIALFSAFCLDCLFGDPVYKLHPVRLIGNLIKFFEEFLYDVKLNKILTGFFLLFSVVVAVSAIFIFFYYIFILLHPKYAPYLLSIFLFYSCISLKDLIKHSLKILRALKKSLTEARKETQNIVGRDVNYLDRDGILKAIVESVAESFVDGVLSPFFWYLIGSLINIIVFKKTSLLLPILFVLIQRTVNTLDSMVGYKNEKYNLFGRLSAKTDDVLNFIPARLSVLIIVMAAFLLRLDYRNSLKIAFRDRLNHKSPNSAHPESAVAGALGVQLGGPTIYPYGKVNKPYLGDKVKELEIEDTSIAMQLIKISSYISLLLSSLILLLA